MKIVLLGTSEFALRCAEAIIESGFDICAFITMNAAVLPHNSADVGEFAQDHNIPFHEIEDVNAPDSINLIQGYAPDYLFVSWPKLLGRDVLEIPRFCCIGTHPTDIPFNRGRHPLHWLIVLGIQDTTLSFFRIDEGVDTGRILLKVPFEIIDRDTVADVVAKMTETGYLGAKMLCERLKKNPEYIGESQNLSKGNLWRKRTPHDVTLDLRLSTDSIVRIVRSYAPPYPCANLIFEKDIVKISDANIVEPDMGIEDVRRLEQGRILKIDKKVITVKADNGIVNLTSNENLPESIKSAKYIHPPTLYLRKWPEVFADFL